MVVEDNQSTIIIKLITFLTTIVAKVYLAILIFITNSILYLSLLNKFHDYPHNLYVIIPDILSTAYSSVAHGSLAESDNLHNINDKTLTMDYDNSNDANGGPFSVMSDHELSSLNIKDLNRKLKEKGLSKEMIEKLKQRRRTLKNRKYATE